MHFVTLFVQLGLTMRMAMLIIFLSESMIFADKKAAEHSAVI